MSRIDTSSVSAEMVQFQADRHFANKSDIGKPVGEPLFRLLLVEPGISSLVLGSQPLPAAIWLRVWSHIRPKAIGQFNHDTTIQFPAIAMAIKSAGEFQSESSPTSTFARVSAKETAPLQIKVFWTPKRRRVPVSRVRATHAMAIQP